VPRPRGEDDHTTREEVVADRDRVDDARGGNRVWDLGFPAILLACRHRPKLTKNRWPKVDVTVRPISVPFAEAVSRMLK
jgi:hypothetical protein